jgi:hypothetical protein
VDCRRNSRRQWVPSPVSSYSSANARTSVSRKQARAAPGGSVPTASHACRASVSGPSVARAGSRSSGEVSAVSQASTAPRPPRCAIPARASRSRTAASTRTSSASAMSAAGSAGVVALPAGSARATGGIVATSASTAAWSMPCATGRQRGAPRNPPGPGSAEVAAAGEVVRERDDGPQVRNGRAVAQPPPGRRAPPGPRRRPAPPTPSARAARGARARVRSERAQGTPAGRRSGPGAGA